MARVRGIAQFYLPPTYLSRNGMNHPAINTVDMVNIVSLQVGQLYSDSRFYQISIKASALTIVFQL